jgi:hypothetical protein
MVKQDALNSYILILRNLNRLIEVLDCIIFQLIITEELEHLCNYTTMIIIWRNLVPQTGSKPHTSYSWISALNIEVN